MKGKRFCVVLQLALRPEALFCEAFQSFIKRACLVSAGPESTIRRTQEYRMSECREFAGGSRKFTNQEYQVNTSSSLLPHEG